VSWLQDLSDQAALREWIATYVPEAFRGLIAGAPLSVIIAAATVVILASLWACVTFVQNASRGLKWLVQLFTQPRKAAAVAFAPPELATQFDVANVKSGIESQSKLLAQMTAQLDRMEARTAQSASPLGADERGRRNAAAAEIVGEASPASAEASRRIAAGDLAGAVIILERDARVANQDAAERWRRLGALVRGVDTAKALAAYEQAFRLQPEDFWTCIELARLQRTAGNLTGSNKAALAAKKAATDQRESSIASEATGKVLMDQGNLAGALKSYRDNLAIGERLVKSDPDNTQLRGDLSGSYIRVGDVQAAQGNLAGALKSYRDSLAIVERLAQSDPSNAGWQRELSVSYNRIGDVQIAQGNLADALKSYRSDLAIAERLAQSDPGNAGCQHDLSVSYDRVGVVQVAQGDLADALKSYRDSVAIRERLAQSDPGNAGWQNNLSVSYHNVGDVHMAQGDLAAALKSHRDSLAIREWLAQSDPGNARWQRELSVSYSKIGVAALKIGQKKMALDAFRKAREIITPLTKLAPDNGTWKSNLAWFESQIAALTS
jgi:tetratricopeptide (TPR) repeat protein